MKYRLEVENGHSVEVLTINGQDYRREGVDKGNGIIEYTGDEEFCEHVEADEEIFHAIWETLDTNFFASDVIALCSMTD